MNTNDEDKTEIISAISDLAYAVERIQLVCEDLIDCNDARLIEARGSLFAAMESINRLNND